MIDGTPKMTLDRPSKWQLHPAERTLRWWIPFIVA